jgi:hydroxymethylpyrimidine pyrophosphatase-like HAD family hydrolase
MIQRAYDAILLDLDGTLVDAKDRIHPRTRAALRAAHERGVVVMIATGRSETATIPVIEELGIDRPAVVYNGAGLYCPVERRMLEERVLSPRTQARAVQWALDQGHLVVSMCAGRKYTTVPATAVERLALHDMTGLVYVPREGLFAPMAMRVTLYSERHPDSLAFALEAERAIDQPVYLTHFPLNWLPQHRSSDLLVCDVQPPCRGKAEGLRVLSERFGIPPERVAAVGDADNDVPMLAAAGLGVAMQNAYPAALAVAERVIGSNDSDAIALLVEDLFGVRAAG